MMPGVAWGLVGSALILLAGGARWLFAGWAIVTAVYLLAH
jgi:hypothetical protein